MKIEFVRRSLVLLCATAVHSACASDSTFVMSTSSLDPYVSSFLGNGSLSIITSRLGIDAEQSYAAAVYDHGKGDIPRIACLPAWNEMNVFDGRTWLNESPVDSLHVQSFHQSLDMYDGTLTTSYRWTDNGKRTDVNVRALICRDQRSCALVRLTLRPRYAGRLKVSFPLSAWPAPVRLPLAELDTVYYGKPGLWPVVWYPGHMSPAGSGVSLQRNSALLWLDSRSDGRETPVAEAVQANWPADLNSVAIDTSVSEAGVRVIVSFRGSAGKPYTFTKVVWVAAGGANGSPHNEAVRMCRKASARGYEGLLRDHTSAWHRLWETDILLRGRPELQRVVHSMIFYLVCSCREETELGIPPMGLSSAGYYGHIFWDSDTWMFPPLLLMYPRIARSMVMFRSRTLEAALRNAKQNGYSGAMYPWEADERGEETTPRFAHQNASFENHIVGDVALAQWQYFLATGDTLWLGRYGYGVLRETANFWTSRATYDKKRGRFAIANAVSVNEGLIGIANDTYTNAVCVANLKAAGRTCEILGRVAPPLWRRIASELPIPYDTIGGFHPVYEGASFAQGSAGLALSYPLGFPISVAAKRKDLESDLQLRSREGPGAMMGETLYPLAAAELGDTLLLDSLLEASYRPFLRPPFNVLSETPANSSVNFLTGAGGFLQQVIFGYSGLRLEEGGLVHAYKPALPIGISSMLLRNFTFRGTRCDIEVNRDTTIIRRR